MQKLDWFELSGEMEHVQYEQILEACFEMYERFGLTGERAEEPSEHKLFVRFTPYRFERDKDKIDEVKERIREKICKFLLSLGVEKRNPWFGFGVNDEIMQSFEPDFENQSMTLTYKKKD